MRTVLRHQISRKPFVTVANEVARDDRLSYAARGLLIAMLSRPTNWAFSADRLADGSPADGRRPVMRYLRELEAVGYVFRYRERAGNLMRTVTVVSDTPITDWQAVLAGHVSDESLNPESAESVPPVGSTDFGTPGTGTPESGTPYERQRTKDRDETKIPGHPSIHPQDQSTVRRTTDSDAGASGPVPSGQTGAPAGARANGDSQTAQRNLDSAMNGWNRDRRRRKPWTELQAAYDAEQIDDDEAIGKLDELLGGMNEVEESTARGMLFNAKLIVIYNTIRKDRRTP